jgi:hypothetical protein
MSPPGAAATSSALTAGDHGVSPLPRMRVRTGQPAAPKARARIAAADKPSASLWLMTSAGELLRKSASALGKAARTASALGVIMELSTGL